MRAPAKVILIAFSASVIAPPVAAACSPQDYMSPEEWQALSPEQQAENVAHTHDVAAPPAPSVAPGPAADTPTSEAAPQTADDVAGTAQPVADAPAAVTVPQAQAPGERRSAGREEPRQRRVIVRMPAERPTRVSPPPRSSRTGPASPAAAAEVRAPIVPDTAREPAVGTIDRRSTESRRSQRRSADRQRTPDQRRRSTPQLTAVPRTDAGQMSDVRVATEASPTVAARDEGERGGFGLWAALAAVLAAVAALVAVGRGGPGAGVSIPATTDPLPPIDPVEVELQAIIAGHELQSGDGTEPGVPSGAHDMRA